ncbi:signal peptidase I [Priestia abyssalis]|uniref:signal peptidase I n=1 Tax=Priestia abyssalis TaxID=1221450 RepID=UPI000994CF82|nr:signal peptidase I [Priestia abyssalis]
MNTIIKREVLGWIKALAFGLVITFICKQFIFVPSEVEGASMMPSLEDGDRMIVSKISEIQRFDQVMFRAPDADENYVKRVIGLPGDTLEMKNDTLYVNGEVRNEPYLKTHKEKLIPNQRLTEDFTLIELTNEKTVPEGYLFVLGDNRLISKDSRYFGLIPIESVVGKVEFRIWPLNNIGATK